MSSHLGENRGRHFLLCRRALVVLSRSRKNVMKKVLITTSQVPSPIICFGDFIFRSRTGSHAFMAIGRVTIGIFRRRARRGASKLVWKICRFITALIRLGHIGSGSSIAILKVWLGGLISRPVIVSPRLWLGFFSRICLTGRRVAGRHWALIFCRCRSFCGGQVGLTGSINENWPRLTLGNAICKGLARQELGVR